MFDVKNWEKRFDEFFDGNFFFVVDSCLSTTADIFSKQRFVKI